MSRFTIERSAKADSHWAVHKDGVPVAWFEGTNAAERWIAEQEAIAREMTGPSSDTSVSQRGKRLRRY